MTDKDIAVTIPMERYKELMAAYFNGMAVAKVLKAMPYTSETGKYVKVCLDILEGEKAAE